MPCEVGPNLSVYHIYTTNDPKDVGGALCWGQPIIHKEVSSNSTHWKSVDGLKIRNLL